MNYKKWNYNQYIHELSTQRWIIKKLDSTRLWPPGDGYDIGCSLLLDREFSYFLIRRPQWSATTITINNSTSTSSSNSR